MSRKLSRILAVLLVIAVLAGCTAPPPAAQPAAGSRRPQRPPPNSRRCAGRRRSKGEIVFIPKSTSATFYLFLVKGAQDKAKELGYTIDYQGPATEADIAAQVDLVRNITAKKPAGILLAALDSKALIPPVEEAMAAGVPVAMADSGIDSDVPVASIITDQYKGGFMAGEEMARLLDKKGAGRQPGHPGRLRQRRAQQGLCRCHRPVPGHEGAGDAVDRRRCGQVAEHCDRP